MFNLIEQALLGGGPVAFFQFTRGPNVWRYTTADRPLELLGNTYTPAPIKRSAIKLGSERRKQPITVTLPRDLAVVANWWPLIPRDPIGLTIYVRHKGDDEHQVDWIGRVRAPKISPKAGTVALNCDPGMGVAQTAAPVWCWQRGCQKILYQCGVDKAASAVPATLTAGADAVSFTSPAFLLVPDGRLAGGFLEYARAGDGLPEHRTIVAHAGNAVTIEYPLHDPPADLAMDAFPGCTQDWDGCAFHNNTDEFGGDLYLPERDPTDGNPVW